MNSDQISLLTGHSDRDVVNKHYNNQKVENLIVQKNVIFNQLFK